MRVVGEQRSNGVTVLCLEGPLRAPVGPELRQRVEAALRRGEPLILLDLARVATVDAAGVGELVHVYRMAAGATRALQIVRAGRHIREMLNLAGLFEPLNADAVLEYEKCL